MSSSENDHEEKTLQQHAQLLTELPTVVGTFRFDLYRYQGIWLNPRAMLGAMMMQNHFTHHSNDIFLSSFMKSGTTWLKSLMFTNLNRSRFDFSDHPLLSMGPQDCFPDLNFYHPNQNSVIDTAPRLFATHFAHNLLPSSITDPSSTCKFVYVWRDPKDVLVSWWHFVLKIRSKELPPLSFETVFEKFCEGVIEYGPYWGHVLGFWEACLKLPNKILFFKYEEMKRDPGAHVKKLAEFMGVPISVEEEENGMVEKIVEFCSIEHLASLEVNKTGAHRSVGGGFAIPNQAFMRRGEVGDWKCHLTDEMKDRIDRITEDKFKDSGLALGATLPK